MRLCGAWGVLRTSAISLRGVQLAECIFDVALRLCRSTLEICFDPVTSTPGTMASQPAPGVLRTPESAFAGLVPGAGDPSFAHVGGAVTAAFQDRLSAGDRPALAAFPADGPRVRMAYIDEGKRSSGECILLLHGEPSWSFLYRKMVAPLVARGFRVVAPDLVGFGRSDKPGRREDYTYDR